MKEAKKIIKFINSEYNIIKVKIPNSITKLEFYSIANLYKALYFSKFLLIHKNLILEKDDSSIDGINDGDFVIIIENRNYPDNSYYSYLRKKSKNDEKINIEFNNSNGEKTMISLPINTSISEMLNAYNLRNGFDCVNYLYKYNEEKLSPDDKRKIGVTFKKYCEVIYCIPLFCVTAGHFMKGKKIIGKT